MLPDNFCKQATLFECVDPMEEELRWRRRSEARFAGVIEIADTWCDVRHGSAKIVAAGADRTNPNAGLRISTWVDHRGVKCACTCFGTKLFDFAHHR